MKYTLVCQEWEESERGWGVRPDGYTLHLTEEDRKAFIRDYINQTETKDGSVPDEYTRPSGDPFTVTVAKKTYDNVKVWRLKHGVWGTENRCPFKVEEKIYTGKL